MKKEVWIDKKSLILAYSLSPMSVSSTGRTQINQYGNNISQIFSATVIENNFGTISPVIFGIIVANEDCYHLNGVSPHNYTQGDILIQFTVSNWDFTESSSSLGICVEIFSSKSGYRELEDGKFVWWNNNILGNFIFELEEEFFWEEQYKYEILDEDGEIYGTTESEIFELNPKKIQYCFTYKNNESTFHLQSLRHDMHFHKRNETLNAFLPESRALSNQIHIIAVIIFFFFF